jgi:hypothetical protein
VDLENSHFYCVFFISEEESKMATGHVTRGLRKFPFLHFYFISEEESKMATGHVTGGRVRCAGCSASINSKQLLRVSTQALLPE